MHDLDLNKSPGLPSSSASYQGGSGGATDGVSAADLKRGYSRGDHSHGEWDSFMPDDNTDGNPRTRGGFLSRPQGEER